MKQLIKNLIPRQLMPFVQLIHRKYFAISLKVDFSSKHYRLLSALKCIVSYNKYGGYCVPESSRHRPAVRKILANDVHEPKTIEFILSNCGSGDIVHAGTYFGDFLPALSKGCVPGAKVLAFEPNIENYRCADITIRINDLENVELLNVGLGARQEILFMKISDENGLALGGASQIFDKEEEGALSYSMESIRIVALDEIVKEDRNVSIIQLDVEGHEKEALQGALKTIQRCLPIIIVEVLQSSTLIASEWFLHNILNLGYCRIENIHGNSVFKCHS